MKEGRGMKLAHRMQRTCSQLKKCMGDEVNPTKRGHSDNPKHVHNSGCDWMRPRFGNNTVATIWHRFDPLNTRQRRNDNRVLPGVDCYTETPGNGATIKKYQ